ALELALEVAARVAEDPRLQHLLAEEAQPAGVVEQLADVVHFFNLVTSAGARGGGALRPLLAAGRGRAEVDPAGGGEPAEGEGGGEQQRGGRQVQLRQRGQVRPSHGRLLPWKGFPRGA